MSDIVICTKCGGDGETIEEDEDGNPYLSSCPECNGTGRTIPDETEKS